MKRRADNEPDQTQPPAHQDDDTPMPNKQEEQQGDQPDETRTEIAEETQTAEATPTSGETAEATPKSGEKIEDAEGQAEEEDGGKTKAANYRTRRCIRWAQGACHLGESCTFLHSGESGTHFPCRNFLNGYCSRGRLCDFKHEINPSMFPGMLPFHPGVPLKKSSSPCRHYDKGYCCLGMSCGFMHNPRVPGANLPADATTTQCRHFERGFCNMGENCGFAHGDKEGSTKPLLPSTAPSPSNLCRHYERGFCRLGQTCGFQHPGYLPPVVDNRYSIPYMAQPYAVYPAFAPSPLPPRVPSRPRIATELCRHWAKGYCQLDDRCGFLHPATS